MSTPDALSFSHLLGFLLLPSRVAAPLLLHSRSHCLHSLLPCCSGNLDVIYSANGQLTRVMLGSSVAQSFDATAVQNQKNNVDQLPLQDGATVASSEVVVGPPTTDPAGSECRNPTDQYVTVQTTLTVDSPPTACSSPECMLLDPIKLVNECIVNAQGAYSRATRPRVPASLRVLVRRL